ncbi:MAG TPA: hypothetical protein VG102_01590 [Candidatus Paceibacterota bacterium]|jgi:hypothetical protein|nr:hypothetical protein [Candidatus Paceibacterota bacterium]
MERKIRLQWIILSALAISLAFSVATLAYAQTSSQNQLRATIYAEITADPRSQSLTQAQIYALVNALSNKAQEQGVTSDQLTYRPQVPTEGASTFMPCNGLSCSISQAFGLDGSFPIIPIALFALAALFILIYGVMREIRHPHVKV